MQKFVRGFVMLGALIWSSVAWAVVRESAVNVSSAGTPVAGATISIKPAARTTPRPVSTAQRPARVAPPRVTTRNDGTYVLVYDDELHRGMLFDVTMTASGRTRTLRGLSIEQILAGIDVAAPRDSAPPATAFPPAGPGAPLLGSPGAAPSIEFNASGSGNLVELPNRGFIARELQGSGVQEFNQVRPLTRSTGAGAQFKIIVNDAPTPASRIFFTFNYFNIDADSSGGGYDPGAGFRVNIAGAAGGASGVSVGGHPLNVVSNIQFSNNTEGFGGGGGVRLPVAGTPASGTSFEAVIGISGNRLTMNESFGGRIAGFGRDFLYTTDVAVDSAQVDLGVGLTQVVRSGAGGIVIVNGDITVSPGVFSGNGTDRFSFTGIAPSEADLNKTKADVGIGVSAGMSFGLLGATVSRNRINGPSIFVKGSYESRPGFPVIERDGTNPSRLELKRADIFTLSGGLTIPLNTIGR